MTVTETSLYANLHVETSPVASTAVWTDHIANVRDINLTSGGREEYINVSTVEVGSGTITLVDLAATINPGYWVRVRYSSTNIWAGYVQDVNTVSSFINGAEYVVTTLVVLDWVAWVSQYSFNNYAAQSGSINNRINNLNSLIDPSLVSSPIASVLTLTPPTAELSAINEFRTVSDVMDLTSNSYPSVVWRSSPQNPTGTGGMNGLVYFLQSVPGPSTTITDGSHTGSPSPLLYYNDAEIAKQTSQVGNQCIVRNNILNRNEMISPEYSKGSSTSIATYGSRLASMDVNLNWSSYAENLFPTPSFENTDISWSSTNWWAANGRPTKDSTGSWNAKDGLYAMRLYNTTGAGTFALITDDKRIEVTAGTTYYMIAYGAHSNSSSVRGRIGIVWYNEAGNAISTTYGAYTTFTSTKTWYKCTGSGAAPAGAVEARVQLYVDRSTGAAFASGTKLWGDAFYFGTTNATDWFDGSFADTSSYLYYWTGTEYDSSSVRATNSLDAIANDFLTNNSTPYLSPISARINAQSNIAAVTAVDSYGVMNFFPFKTTHFWRGGHRWTAVITGVTHSITVNPDGTTRWMIDLILRPSAYTI